MPINIRLSNNERKKLREKTIEINIQLVKKRKEPLRKSEVAHIIIKNGLENISTSEKGEIFINGKIIVRSIKKL